MNNTPVVILFDPWRRAFSFSIQVLLGFGPATVVVVALGWSPMVDLYASLIVVVLINYVIYLLLLRTFLRLIFPDAEAGSRALGMEDYRRALAFIDKHGAYLDRHPWMDKWRTVLFQDVSKTSMRETAWQICGYCCSFLGDLDRAVDYYERCLAINASSPMALGSLNSILLFRGEPVRRQSDIMLRYAFDRGQRGLRRQAISLISFTLGLAVVCPMMFIIIFYQVDNPLSFPLTILVALTFAIVFRVGWRWLARHMFLSTMLQGFTRMKDGDYAGAIESFERQYNELMVNPFIDDWRLVVLFETSAYPYREWLLLYQVTPSVQLGQPDRVVAIYEECLKLNPDNVYARAGITMVRKLQTVIAQEREQPTRS